MNLIDQFERVYNAGLLKKASQKDVTLKLFTLERVVHPPADAKPDEVKAVPHAEIEGVPTTALFLRATINTFEPGSKSWKACLDPLNKRFQKLLTNGWPMLGEAAGIQNNLPNPVKWAELAAKLTTCQVFTDWCSQFNYRPEPPLQGINKYNQAKKGVPTDDQCPALPIVAWNTHNDPIVFGISSTLPTTDLPAGLDWEASATLTRQFGVVPSTEGDPILHQRVGSGRNGYGEEPEKDDILPASEILRSQGSQSKLTSEELIRTRIFLTNKFDGASNYPVGIHPHPEDSMLLFFPHDIKKAGEVFEEIQKERNRKFAKKVVLEEDDGDKLPIKERPVLIDPSVTKCSVYATAIVGGQQKRLVTLGIYDPIPLNYWRLAEHIFQSEKLESRLLFFTARVRTGIDKIDTKHHPSIAILWTNYLTAVLNGTTPPIQQLWGMVNSYFLQTNTQPKKDKKGKMGENPLRAASNNVLHLIRQTLRLNYLIQKKGELTNPEIFNEVKTNLTNPNNQTEIMNNSQTAEELLGFNPHQTFGPTISQNVEWFLAQTRGGLTTRQLKATTAGYIAGRWLNLLDYHVTEAEVFRVNLLSGQHPGHIRGASYRRVINEASGVIHRASRKTNGYIPSADPLPALLGWAELSKEPEFNTGLIIGLNTSSKTLTDK